MSISSDFLSACFRPQNASGRKKNTILLPLVRVLENQIQGLLRTMSVFKDFPGLENLEKLFQDFQGLSRTHKSPVTADFITHNINSEINCQHN